MCLRIIIVSSVSVILPLLSVRFLPDGFAGFAISVLICLASAGTVAVFLGLKKSERRELVSMLKRGGNR